MYFSHLTSKYQATIPVKVREELGLKKGDSVAFEVRGKRVTLKKATPFDLGFAKSLESTLDEWSSDNDEKAYRDL